MFPNSDVATMSRISLRERVSRNKIHFEQIGLANHDKYTPLGLLFICFAFEMRFNSNILIFCGKTEMNIGH